MGVRCNAYVGVRCKAYNKNPNNTVLQRRSYVVVEGVHAVGGHILQTLRQHERCVGLHITKQGRGVQGAGSQVR